LGYRSGELIGKSSGALFDGLVFLNHAEMPASGDNARRDYEGYVIHKNGERIPALLSVSAPRDRDRRFGGFIITAKDMRERIHAEEIQKQMERQLVQSERMAAVGTVAAGIVHNLKNPLTGILGFAGLLKMKHPEMTEVDRILISAENMNIMIENILSKSRQKRTADALDLNKLLERELDFLMADRMFKNDVVKQIELADSLPLIRGVYTDFSQAFGNLLRNAIEAMYDQPRKILRVTTARDIDGVKVEIADTGSGISKEHRPHLFESFFTTKTGKDGPQGTGLGLYMTRQLLDAYGATIEVESEEAQGTVFRVRIPLQPPVAPDGGLTA